MAGTRKPATSPRPHPAPAEEPVVEEEPEPERVVEEPEAETEPEPAPKPAPKPKPKPSPRSKTRDSGIRKPVKAEELEEQAEGERDPEELQAAKSRRNKFLLAGALTLVGLLLVGAAVFFKFQQSDLDSVTSNTALLDMAKTSQVKQDVNTAVETLFSYNYNDIAKTENAAKDLLITDTVREKYNKEFAEVKRLAPQQKMVVTTKVTRSAVVLLDGDRAKVLVFVDQTSIRTDNNQRSVGGSQLSVTSELHDGKWRVSDMDAYNTGQPPPASGQPPLPQGSQQAPPPSK